MYRLCRKLHSKMELNETKKEINNNIDDKGKAQKDECLHHAKRRDNSEFCNVLIAVLLLPLMAFLVFQFIAFSQSPSHLLPKLAAELSKIRSNDKFKDLKTEVTNVKSDRQSIAFVSCGSKSRLEEISVLIKSIFVFADQPTELIFFTDSLGQEVQELVDQWNNVGIYHHISLVVKEPFYPVNEVIYIHYVITVQLLPFIHHLSEHVIHQNSLRSLRLITSFLPNPFDRHRQSALCRHRHHLFDPTQSGLESLPGHEFQSDGRIGS